MSLEHSREINHAQRPAPALLTVQEAMVDLKSSRATLYRALASGHLTAVKRGRRTLIRADALAAWIELWPEFQPRVAA